MFVRPLGPSSQLKLQNVFPQKAYIQVNDISPNSIWDFLFMFIYEGEGEGEGKTLFSSSREGEGLIFFRRGREKKERGREGESLISFPREREGKKWKGSGIFFPANLYHAFSLLLLT